MVYETVRRAADYTFKVRSNVAEAGFVLDRLLASFPEVPVVPGRATPTYALWEDAGEEGRPFTLTLDGGQIQRVEHAGSMVDWLLIDVTRRAVERSEGYVSIHAGVVSSDGRAIILPAEPSSGKTTTVAGLVRAGFSYLSDEVALVRLADARVCPFPRSLVMDARSVEAVSGLRDQLPDAYDGFRGRWFHVAPEDLRPEPTGDTADVAWIIAPRYSEGAETSLRRLSRAQTLFILAEHAFDLARSPAGGLAVLRDLALRVPGYELTIGDLGSAVDVVSQLVENDPTIAMRKEAPDVA